MSDPNAELSARVAALEGQVTSITAERDAAIAERDGLQQQLAQQFAARRREEVTALFAAVGRKADDDSIAPYLSMSDAQFAAVAAHLREARPANPGDGLDREVATGQGVTDKPDPATIAARAREFHAAEHKAGRRISFTQAVAAVTKESRP